MNIDECYREGLLKKTRPQEDAARKEISNARDYLMKAEKNREMNIHDIAIIASYTSMFHAARSLLFRDGVKERSHVCLVIYLREKYPELGHYINVLDSYRRFRHTALYGLDIRIDERESAEAIKLAGEFISRIEDIL